jgi:CBS domain-containing protein
MSHELTEYTVAPTDSVRTAMEKIERNKHRVVIVVDEGRVVGTVSDGDIRRAFLHDVLPMAPVERIMQLNPRTTTQADRAKRHAEALSKKLTVLPVVDDEMRLLDVELAYEPFTE